MVKRVGFVVALLLALSVLGAAAAEIEGTVKMVDQTERAFVLDDGTKIWVAEGLSMDEIKEGAKVKASYEERDGKNVATNVEVSD
jgi:cold shock CspA family protein